MRFLALAAALIVSGTVMPILVVWVTAVSRPPEVNPSPKRAFLTSVALSERTCSENCAPSFYGYHVFLHPIFVVASLVIVWFTLFRPGLGAPPTILVTLGLGAFAWNLIYKKWILTKIGYPALVGVAIPTDLQPYLYRIDMGRTAASTAGVCCALYLVFWLWGFTRD